MTIYHKISKLNQQLFMLRFLTFGRYDVVVTTNLIEQHLFRCSLLLISNVIMIVRISAETEGICNNLLRKINTTNTVAIVT
jgi:hypothetical protein